MQIHGTPPRYKKQKKKTKKKMIIQTLSLSFKLKNTLPDNLIQYQFVMTI